MYSSGTTGLKMCGKSSQCQKVKNIGLEDYYLRPLQVWFFERKI